MSQYGVVIVGGGQAGGQLAISLRDKGYDKSILLISDEPFVPYQRPPLSKAYLADKVQIEHIHLKPFEYFENRGIDLLLSTKVVSIDRKAHVLFTDEGDSYSYESLVFATGARNRELSIPGENHNLPVLGLRTIEDAEYLKEHLRLKNRVLVVGAGYIGLEFAAVARSRGLDVHVVEASPRALGRGLSKEAADRLTSLHESKGVTFSFNTTIVDVVKEASDESCTCLLSSGEKVKTDFVVYGIGVIPNTELASSSGVLVNNGIVVDSQLRTSDPDIYAIGDCCSFPGYSSEVGSIRLESVQNAVDQSRFLSEVLTGSEGVYRKVPWFWTEQYEVKLQIAGIMNEYDESVCRQVPGKEGCSYFCFLGDRLVSIESFNRPSDHLTARKILDQNINITSQQAMNPDFDLKSLVSKERG